MTYTLILLPFIAVTIIVTVVSRRRGSFRHRMAASALTAVALVILTAVFDNVMIASGLVVYPPENLSGLRIGVAPLEDFAYPICGAFLLPAVWSLMSRADTA